MEAQEIINFVEGQIKIFEDLMLPRDKDDFYRGVIEGLNLTKQYALLWQRGVDNDKVSSK